MRDLAAVLERQDFPWYLTGSEALAAYGPPRQTLDTDVVDAEVQRLTRAIRELEQDHYVAEPLRIGTRWMASLVDRRAAGKIDLIIRDPDPWGHAAMERRQPWDHPVWGSVWVSSLEDLVLAKLEWSEGTSELELRDCRILMRMNARSIDRHYLGRWAERLGLRDRLAAVSLEAADAP